jgi:hypothetical protein
LPMKYMNLKLNWKLLSFRIWCIVGWTVYELYLASHYLGSRHYRIEMFTIICYCQN